MIRVIASISILLMFLYTSMACQVNFLAPLGQNLTLDPSSLMGEYHQAPDLITGGHASINLVIAVQNSKAPYHMLRSQ